MDFEKLLLELMTAIGQINFGTIVAFILVSFIVFWMVVLGLVWTDSGDRASSRSFRIISVIVVAILFVPGLIIYLLIRPKATIEEIYWADLERRYLKFETLELGDCSNCGFQLQPGFVMCPQCGDKIKEKCDGCGVYIDKSWRYCPACGLERLTKKQAEVELSSQEISSEVMQEVIQNTRKEIKDVVQSGKTRYAARSGIIVAFNSFRDKAKKVFPIKRLPTLNLDLKSKRNPVKKSKSSNYQLSTDSITPVLKVKEVSSKINKPKKNKRKR